MAFLLLRLLLLDQHRQIGDNPREPVDWEVYIRQYWWGPTQE